MPLIELDALVPDDIEIQYRDETYTIRGDLEVELTLRFLKAVMAFDKSEDEAEQESLLRQMEADLLALFQERHPDLEKLPFGLQGVQQVMIALLGSMGVIQDDQEPQRAAGTDPTKRKPPAKKSARSTGSRS